ncbi:hypothetical protein L249_0553 [Ophiocordyceps polyrhachis-furcata BCC 54312]|uniref:ubiquitinyl hydrolase 1 n=1 Tax=Ophiocordyceps polyrhachis-furcata BCC 54312 TaxID=1330021 RepID=A0A367LCY3_9HYPO|nr:hypothetical protein L249_0553 [Ophiocordyceps polyrhachis-furcata BCC 54312]
MLARRLRIFRLPSRSVCPFSSSRLVMEKEYKLKDVSSLSLAPGMKREVEVEGIKDGRVLLLNSAGKVQAVGARCTHYGAPLAKGVLTASGRLTCPWHGACFNASTGDIEDAPGLDALPVFAVSERDGAVYITGDESAIVSSRRNPILGCAAATSAGVTADRVVVVGGGSGAMGLVQALRERGYNGSVTVISKERYLPIDRPKLSKALITDPTKLALRDRTWFEMASIDWVEGEVSGVDFAARSVTTKDGSVFPYGKLVLATGGAPRTLPLQGFKVLGNIFTLRTVPDAKDIVDAIGEKGKKIVIIGSSFIGMEAAIATCKDNTVTVVDMAKTPLERVLGEQVGDGIRKIAESKGIKFYMGAGIDKAEPSGSDPSKVGAVCLKDGTKLEADMVILGVGVAPATEFLRDNSVLRLEQDGSIKTNENFEVVGLKDVYALGDIATHPYHGPGGDGKPVRIEHWNVAQNSGRRAAAHIAQRPDGHGHSIPVFWSALGAQLRYCGNPVNGWDDLVLNGDVSEAKFVAYYAKGETVVAMASMGMDPTMAQSLELMTLGKMPSKSQLKGGLDIMDVGVPGQSVYREDCTQCFDSIDEPSGLDVCLQCFNGACAGPRPHNGLHASLWKHPLALNIRRTRKPVVRDEPPAKISKLAIAAESDEDRYDTALSAKCLDCDALLDVTDPRLAPVVDGIIKANTFARKEEVKAWEQELTSCEHILLLQQHEARNIQQGDLGHCFACDLRENLWLCLECGNLGCGRKQMGGVDGNSHALAHATESTHGVAVKLGSITPEGTADVYCYKCDDERLDDQLGPHLAHWGIMLADRRKTEMSLTEMQIEQNLNASSTCHPLESATTGLPDPPPQVQDPAADLETQLRKVADGLLSGRYAKPDDDEPEVSHQRGLAPAMLKHLIGRGHPEFSTMRQQDAFELFQHLCLGCGKVRYSTHEQDSIFIDVPLEKLPRAEGDAVDQYKPVSLKQCLESLTKAEKVELACSSCRGTEGFSKKSLFKTFPQVLVVNANKMSVINWVPVKVDVPVLVPDEPFLLDDYLSKGLQASEEPLPDEPEAAAPAFVPEAAALSQLEEMGFPRNRCEKALHATGNSDANAAMEWLFAHMEDADIDAPLDLGGGGASVAADPAKIEMLGAMGFDAPRAGKALKETGGDVERAVEWLFNHPSDVVEDEAAPAADEPAGSASLPASFQLRSLVCHKGTSIHAGHYVAFVRKQLEGEGAKWVLFNDEKVVEAHDVEEMRKFAYVYFFERK